MITVTQSLWFDKDMEGALRFYTAHVPNSSMGEIHGLPAESPSGPANSVLIADFILGGQHYQAMQAGPFEPFNHAFSITLTCDDQDEIDRLWEAFKEGGSVEQCGWLTDRWGLSWQIVPKVLGELIAGPDRAAAKRVAEAMLKMVKFDIAALERAAAGDEA